MPSDRRLVLLAVVVGVVALVLVGRLLQGGGASARAPVAIPTVALATAADPALGPVTVYVVGAVRRPGVLVLPAGSRARDALKRAGGALPRADLAQLNLAVRLADGEMIVVPRRGAAAPAVAASGTTAAPAIVHLNSATVEQLDGLDGIGPSLAARIVAWRTEHGGFHTDRRSRPGRRHRARAPRGPPWTRRTVRLSPAASLLPSLPGWRCRRRSSPGRSAISAVQRSPVSQRCDCGCPAASAWSAPWWLWALGGLVSVSHLRSLAQDPLASEIGDPVQGRAVVTGSVIHGQWDQRAIARFRDADVLLRVAASIETGDVVELEGRLREPRGPTADGFDERTWLARQGVHEVLRARSAHVVGRRGGVWGLIDRVRNNARDALRVGGGDGEAVADGVLLGGNDGLTPDTRDAFRASGLGHLLAVSGQNVVLLVAAILVVCGCLGVARAPALGLAIAATVLYVLVVGPGASVVRAGITGVVVAVAWLANRPAARWHVLAVAAAGCLWLDPWAVVEPGFQLSFVAVVAIFVAAPRIRSWLEGTSCPSRLREPLAISTACTLATAPIAWLQFDRVALAGSLPANLAALPAVAPLLWIGIAATLVHPLAPAAAVPLALAASALGEYLVVVAHAGARIDHFASGAEIVLAIGVPVMLAAFWFNRAPVRVLRDRGAGRARVPAVSRPRHRWPAARAIHALRDVPRCGPGERDADHGVRIRSARRRRAGGRPRRSPLARVRCPPPRRARSLAPSGRSRRRRRRGARHGSRRARARPGPPDGRALRAARRSRRRGGMEFPWSSRARGSCSERARSTCACSGRGTSSRERIRTTPP